MHLAAVVAIAVATTFGARALAEDELAAGMKAEVLTLATAQQKKNDAESSLKAAMQAEKVNRDSYYSQHAALQAQLNASGCGPGPAVPDPQYSACHAKAQALQQIDDQNYQTYLNATEADRKKIQRLPGEIAGYEDQIATSKARIASLRARLLQKFPNCTGMDDEALSECAGRPFTGGAVHPPLPQGGVGRETRFFSVPTNGRPAVVELSKQFDVLETQRGALVRQLSALEAQAGTPQNHIARARLKQQISNIEARENFLIFKAREKR